MSRTAPRMEQVEAKRAGAYEVFPVVDDDTKFEVQRFSVEDPEGDGYKLRALDLAGSLKWETIFYSNTYIPHLETDVQWVFVVDLYVEGEFVCIKMEHRPVIKVNRVTGQVQA